MESAYDPASPAPLSSLAPDFGQGELPRAKGGAPAFRGAVFVKLFQSIMKSSVWDESPTTRLVWITFLLLADEDGMVKGVEKGIARAANVSQDDFRKAIEVLEAPDLESQSQDHAGRRIEKVEGGWIVLNYAKYREYRTRAQVKAAEKKQRQRTKRKQDNEIDAGNSPPDAVVPGHVPDVPTITSVSSSVPAVKDDEEFSRFSEVGGHRNWCAECGGMKDTRGGSPHLRHRSHCSRRTG